MAAEHKNGNDGGGGGGDGETPSEAKCGDELKWRDMGAGARVRFVYEHCTIEPIFGCYILTSMLTGLATQNLNLQKACRVNLRLAEATCAALDGLGAAGETRPAAEEVAVQQLVADMTAWKTVVQSAVPSALIVFVGSWSDRHRRRKPCMLVPVAGELFATVGLMVCAHYYYELPMQVTGLVESLPTAMTGGWMTMVMAVFSYIGDVSSVKYRTLRIGLASVFFSVAVPIGTALSGILLKKLGFYGVYTIAIVMYTLIIAYGMVYIKDVKPEQTTDCKEPSSPQASKPLEVNPIKDFFRLSYVKEAIVVTFKEGQHNRRIRITLLMVVVFVVMGPLHGEMSILYMFTRVKFNWNEIDYSIFSTYSMVTNLLGTMFSVGMFSHKLKIDDSLIGVMSCMSKIFSGFIYAFASTEFVFYLGPLVEIINGTSFIAMRSIISKLVPSNELGKVNSIFGVCESIVPLFYGPMYSFVYKATLETFPGMFFLVGSVLTAPAALIFLWMYGEHVKEQTKKTEVADQEKNAGEDHREHPEKTSVPYEI